MSRDSHPRRGRQAMLLLQTVLTFATIFTLLISRNTPPTFPRVPTLSHSISAVLSPAHRPQFDSNGVQWSAPVDSSLLIPSSATSAHFNPACQRFSGIQTKGFHYNRPPPVL